MAKKRSGLSREFIIHPGETLGEVLKERRMSQYELAVRVGLTEPYISNVVNGQKPLSVSLAKRLEYALGIDTAFWVNLQANYDKELADFKDFNEISSAELNIIRKIKDILEYLKRLGFLEQGVQGPMLVVQLRRLLKVSNIVHIPALSQLGAYRLATKNKVNPYVLFTWVRMCDLIIKHQTVSCVLDVCKLRDKIPLIKELMFYDVAEVQSGLNSILAECGIKFSIVRHFTGAPVQGIIKENDDGTLGLLMTVRRKSADIFWFTLFHEIGHILYGDVKGRLIDYDFAEGVIEDRANEFAENCLIHSDRYGSFVEEKDFSLPAIRQFCTELNIPPYILIGRLQREDLLKYHQYTAERVQYELGENIYPNLTC